jgi:FKBP-type peptidyl-prolyl cis-trans isomerase 2
MSAGCEEKSLVALQAQPGDPASGCPEGEEIAFEFNAFDESGEDLGGNLGGKPRIFRVGGNEMLPALEEQMVALQKGERRSIVLRPEQAYGAVEQELFKEFALASIPEEARQVGRKVMGRRPDGAEEMFDVVDVYDGKVVIDMNHPLAGRTLRFEVRLLERWGAAAGKKA